ncbi:peptidylprolyl isomerase [Verrucomicrobiota bacterium]
MKTAHPLLILSVLLAAAVNGVAGVFTVIRTPVGDMEFELFIEDKPTTVANFIRYISSGRYGDTFVERWNPGFVIQAGGQYVLDPTNTPSVQPVASFGEIVNEYGVGRTFSNTYGTIAMARRGGATNSATSSWFINLGDNSFLDGVDGGFTVFGNLIRGTNVLNKFVTLGAAQAAGIGYVDPNPFHIDFLPVNTTNLVAGYDDLVYLDIAVLTVDIEPMPTGSRRLSWYAPSNVINRLEYRPDLAAGSWTQLLQTNGTGAIVQAVDTNSSSTRFYRVRLEY